MDINSFFHEPSGTVLIVDDDEDMRDILRVELELAGFTVLTAEDGVSGPEKARIAEPDVILMDFTMPSMNGIEATRELKKSEKTSHIPVLIITAVAAKGELIKGLEAGAIDFVNKPFFAPEIRARVKSILRYKRLFEHIQTIKEEAFKEKMMKLIRESKSIVQDAIKDNTWTILRTVHKETLSNNDLKTVEEAVQNIKNTVRNLSSIDSFVFKLYGKIGDITKIKRINLY